VRHTVSQTYSLSDMQARVCLQTRIIHGYVFPDLPASRCKHQRRSSALTKRVHSPSGCTTTMSKKECEAVCKPNSVPSMKRVTVIDLGVVSQRRSTQPTHGYKRGGPPRGAFTPPRLFGLAPDGVYRATPVTRCAVGSYPTVSPLPVPENRPSAVYSLLHFPSPHGARPLAGILPCGVRTFLPLQTQKATARPSRKLKRQL